MAKVIEDNHQPEADWTGQFRCRGWNTWVRDGMGGVEACTTGKDDGCGSIIEVVMDDLKCAADRGGGFYAVFTCPACGKTNKVTDEECPVSLHQLPRF